MKTYSIAFIVLALTCSTLSAQTTQPVEREITVVGAGDVRLGASLLLPAGAGAGHRVPGVIVVAGSGPTDRNGNQGLLLRTDLLKQIALALAENGVASLRFDKRVVGLAAKSMPLDNAGLGSYVAWDNFVFDALAALRTLRQQPEIDPARTGMIGHSEGGLLVLDAAGRLVGNEKAAIVVLVSTPGRAMEVVIDEQLKHLLTLQNATPEQTQFFLKRNSEITAAIRQTGQTPADVPPGLAALYPPYIGRFFQQELLVDPPKLAAQFTGPVLVINGEKDTQVSAQRDATNLDGALKTRKPDDHEVLIIPSASHNLKHVNADTDSGFLGEVPADAMKKIVSWVKLKLKQN